MPIEPESRCKHLVLGTAQLGMHYGIANRTGKPDLRKAEAIIRIAWENGIRFFDTAQAYGNSEETLGDILSRLGLQREIRIISKLDPSLDHLNHESLGHSIRSSLGRLGISSLYCLMLHREKLLDSLDEGIKESLLHFSKAGFYKKIGISVYTPERARQALRTGICDLIQIPANIFDGRFQRAGIFRLVHSESKTVFIRSIFLQGLLFMEPEEIPPEMLFVEQALLEFDRLSRRYELSRASAALGYVRKKYPDAFIIFGAETPKQVEENIANWENPVPDAFLVEADECFRNLEERVVNPLLWPAI